ncbi:hypothetical protein F5Y09DRAFT_76262 [Xylaria sp. FL1042]|nr:hypothetical protein F5Y09DRAFT_76262 [Xylaria sp. FL1042]
MQSSNMMPNHFPLHFPGQVPTDPLYGQGQNHSCQHPPPDAVTPSKRQVDEDDDDIQFISEKPVKKPRPNEKRPTAPVAEKSMNPSAAAIDAAAIDAAAIDAAAAGPTVVPSIPTMAMQTPDSDLKDTERRLSTGMVGLPHDMHAVELTYALRGVSMPVLENFVLDQPLRKPRLASPPELSPKQLPSTVPPAMLEGTRDHSAPEAFGFEKLSVSHMSCASSSHTPWEAGTPLMTSDLTKNPVDTQRTHALETSIHPGSGVNLTSSNHNMKIGSNSIPTPAPGPLTHFEAAHRARCSRSNPDWLEGHHHINSTHPQKHPCQVCSQLRHQAQLSRAQGVPIVNTNLPPRLMSQLQYHTHPYPQMMPISMSGNVHRFGTNFAPVMMPANNNTFVSLPSHPQPQYLSQQMTPTQQMRAEKDNQPTSKRPSKTHIPQASQVKNTVSSSNAASSPLKPPPSLIQPTYRKPSPNLIVDVAETCQEKFPFEEVAKRHNVPVDRVFDVFAAIIQVPLLRCPTDRRRAGRLATARIKEYNKAKKDIEDSAAGKTEGQTPVVTVIPTNIAQRLGPVELPGGFVMDGRTGSSAHS